MLPEFCEPGLMCTLKLLTHQTIMNGIRYYPIAGLAFLVLWKAGAPYFQRFRIQLRPLKNERVWYEIRYSFVTLLVFVAIGTYSITMGMRGETALYLDIFKHGPAYLIFSFLLLIIWHETWFYWMHRMVHFPRLFRLIHLVHHKSTHPTPFAAYSFHPYEAVLEAGYLFLFVQFVPVHPIVVLTQAFYAMLMNIYFHSGHEFAPSGWTRGRLSRWFNTSTHHNMHHSHVNCNYSLYFNFWDRVCGTNHPDYEQYFESIKARSRRTAPGVNPAVRTFVTINTIETSNAKVKLSPERETAG